MLKFVNVTGLVQFVDCAFYDGAADVATRRGFGGSENEWLRTRIEADIFYLTVPLTHRWAVPAGPRQVAVRCIANDAGLKAETRSLTGVVTD
jgi:hypothetical protein